jgi:hypothetical protein
VDERFEKYERQGLTLQSARAHARRLAAKAAADMVRDPSTALVALIFTPDCQAIRASLPSLIQGGMAKASDWVPLLVSRDQALTMLRHDAPDVIDQLEPVRRGSAQRLPVVIVTPFGVKFGYEEFEIAGRSTAPLPAQMTVHAMVLCREVVQMEGSGKWCAIGIHDGVKVAGLPIQHAFGVFISLGDFASGSRVKIVVHRGDVELAQAEAEATIDRPFGSLDLGLSLPGLVFTEAGSYQVDLLAGGKVLARRELTVALVTP